MTAQEMKQEFLVLYDKITNFDAPGYEDDEISIFLTKGQEQVFFAHYNFLANQYKQGFEETEARRKDLNELTKGITLTIPSSDQTNVLPSGVFYDLPTDCLYAISEEVTLASDDPCLDGKRIRIKPITHDEYALNKNNPFKKPSDEVVWRLDYMNRRHELIPPSDATIAQYHLRYIKTLTPIIISGDIIDGVTGPQDCELNPIIHKRIVDAAVRIATGVTDPTQYQVKTIEQKEGE